MPRIARQSCESDIYHVFARGVGRQLIFEDDDDRSFFLGSLEKAAKARDAVLLAWALMGNHFHLLVSAPLPRVSRFMASLSTAYAGYFNGRHDRSGHLFQGRFGTEGIGDDPQLLTAVRYIHQNPQKAGLCENYEYPWTSYDEYVHIPRFCETDRVLEVIGGVEQFVSFHMAEEQSKMMDVDSGCSRRPKIGDDAVLRLVVDIFGDDWRASLAGCGREERDARLRRLKAEGLSVRQIERVTGIGRNIIQRS